MRRGLPVRSAIAAVNSTDASSLTSGLRTRTRALEIGNRSSRESATLAARASIRLKFRPLRDLADALDHLRVVDRVLKLVAADARIVSHELDVEEEALALFLLFCERTVKAPELEALDLDEDLTHATTDRAAARASTFSRTSCTRKRDAPRS